MITYEITVKGRVHGVYRTALEGFDLVPGREGESCFRGEVADQEALHRVLERIAGYNLELIRVERVGPTEGNTPGGGDRTSMPRSRQERP